VVGTPGSATPSDAETDPGGVEEDLLADYLVGLVRIGVISTYLVLVPIGLYPWLAGGVDHPGLYFGSVVVGLLGATGVAFLPWRRMLTSRWPRVGLVGWSVADILLVGLLVAASGGLASPLWSVFTLTTLFFAAAFGLLGRASLFAFTVAVYLAAIWSLAPQTGEVSGELVVRLGVLGTLALMAGFIARQLHHQLLAQSRRAQASRRVAQAGEQIGTLEQEVVFEAAVDGLADLGFPVTAAVTIEGNAYRLAATRGVPPEFARVRLVLSGLRETSRAWVMYHEDIDDPGVIELLRAAGCDALIAAPLLVGSTRVGLLVACGDDDPVGVEAVQTLANLTASALENAELYRAKTEFVANVSHELRTPLTVVIGLSDTLARRTRHLSPEQIEEFAHRIQHNAGRLEAMISTLLDFSRLRTRTGVATRGRIDLVELVSSAVERNRPHLAPREVRLDADPCPSVPGDPLMLEHVVDNLLANVASHTPPTTVVEVTVRPGDDGVAVVVSDDGPGIPPQELPRITERFFRGGDHLTRQSGGLGLGLALAQELLVLHGSGLEIDRSDAGGARVAFLLPSGLPGPSPGRSPAEYGAEA
jgi:two-component system, OmpR family, sensor histidine kinase KdpD